MSSDTKYPSINDETAEGSNPTSGEDAKQDTGGSTTEKSDRNTKYKRGKVTMDQSYNYIGEKEEIGVILALKSEKFANKVAFRTFIDKMKNYVLTVFDEGRDMMPVLENLTDPENDVTNEEPTELTPYEVKSEVKRWIKQEKESSTSRD